MTFTDFLLLVVFSIVLDILICGALAFVGIVGIAASIISFVLLVIFTDEILVAIKWIKAKITDLKGNFKHAV